MVAFWYMADMSICCWIHPVYILFWVKQVASWPDSQGILRSGVAINLVFNWDPCLGFIYIYIYIPTIVIINWSQKHAYEIMHTHLHS